MLELWWEAFAEASSARVIRGRKMNVVSEYLSAESSGGATGGQARGAFNAVRRRFSTKVDNAMANGESFSGVNFHKIHHANWPIGNFPGGALNPRLLFPVSQGQHSIIHRATTIGPHPTNSSVNPLYIQP